MLWQKLYRRTIYFGRKSPAITAMAAVNMAIWVLKGNAFNQAIHRLLDVRPHKELVSYASIPFRGGGNETADFASKWVDAGYSAVKF